MSDLTLTIQLIIDGLATGSIYAALALAIVLVNQATGLINFAQGGMAVLSAYIALVVVNLTSPTIGLNAALILAILISVVISFVLGSVIERVLMRRFERGDPDTAVVATIGLLTLITGLCGVIWGYNYLPFPWFFSTGAAVNVLGVTVSLWSITTFTTILLIMAALQLLFQGTKLGLGLRAVADNPDSAALSGLQVGRLLMVGWGLAAALGAIAGVIVAPKLQLTPGMLDPALVYALAAVIIGGMNSPIGAVVAAWGVAVLENLAAAFVPFIGHDLKVIVPFLILFLVLIVRPQGLFGRKVVVRV
jgi:branched-chain amino acid transport system permease protein